MEDGGDDDREFAEATDALKRLKATQKLKREAIPKSITPLVVDAAELERRKKRNALRFGTPVDDTSSGGGEDGGVGNGGEGAAAGAKATKKRRRGGDLPLALALGTACDEGWSDPSIVINGTSTAIEKSYFRLTSAPDPAQVRPLEVLKQSFALVKQHWRDNEEYEWPCDQLKAIRQDMVVQMLNGAFAVDVYQTHARLALQSGDLNEYNQCQSRLLELRANKGNGDGTEEEVADVKGENEFIAYRLLYSMVRKAKEEVNSLLRSLTPSQKASKEIDHAIQVLKAYHTGDYHNFFLLYQQYVQLNYYLMDFVVREVQEVGYTCMLKAYMPSLPIAFVTKELQFADEQAAIEFITKRCGRDCIIREEVNGHGKGGDDEEDDDDGGGGGGGGGGFVWDIKRARSWLQGKGKAVEAKKVNAEGVQKVEQKAESNGAKAMTKKEPKVEDYGTRPMTKNEKKKAKKEQKKLAKEEKKTEKKKEL